MGMVSFMRTVVTAILIFAVLDTMFAVLLAASGMYVPPEFYIAPMSLNSLIQAAQQANNAQVSASLFSYFLALFSTPTLFFIFTNVVLGMLAGLPIMIAKWAALFRLPIAVMAFLMGGAIFLQAIADIWIVDNIVAYILGRTPLTAMIFED